MIVEIWCHESYFLGPSAVSGSPNRRGGGQDLDPHAADAGGAEGIAADRVRQLWVVLGARGLGPAQRLVRGGRAAIICAAVRPVPIGILRTSENGARKNERPCGPRLVPCAASEGGLGSARPASSRRRAGRGSSRLARGGEVLFTHPGCIFYIQRTTKEMYRVVHKPGQRLHRLF